MCDKTLTTADVLEITGLPARRFQRWCAAGHIRASAGGTGSGNHRRFTLMEALGLAVAAEICRCPQGCVPQYVGKVMRAFGAMQEADLRAEFDKGGTHLAAVHGGKPIMRGAEYPNWIDVQKTYKTAVRKIKTIERKLKEQRGGRRRGLAQRRA